MDYIILVHDDTNHLQLSLKSYALQFQLLTDSKELFLVTSGPNNEKIVTVIKKL